ncbi:MAG: hypothetical protein GWP91_23495, partial [Rhodobacterales bacterium]|nr:hypothetical protein [Rhodobacterales bacterium]
MNARQSLGLLALISLVGCSNTDKDVTTASTNTVQTSTTTPSTSTTTPTTSTTTSTTSTTTGGTLTSECDLPTSTQGVVEEPPVTYTFADYLPGGSTAVSVGDDYHDVSADCIGGVWTPALPLEDGLYYADCDVVLPDDNLEVQLTIATPGHITVSGQAPNLSAFADGLVFITPSVDDLAIQITSSDGTYLGFLYALDGQIAVSGSSNQFYCGLVADRLLITGDNLSVSANECARPEATQAPIILMPHLEVALGNHLSEVLPGEAVTSTATSSNPGALLLMQTVIGLENLGTTSVNVDSSTVVIEALDLATNTWLALDAPVSIEALSNPYTGVTYPVDFFVGTQLDASGLATWNVQLQAELEADEILHLTDPALVGGLRTRVQFDLDDPSAPVRHLYRFGDDFLDEFTPHGGVVQDAGLTVAGVDGQMQFIDGSTVPALASILSGDEVVIDHVANALQPAPIQDGETAEAYLAKLNTLDDSQINALASARGTGGGVGTVLASQVLADTTLFLPIVDLSATVPARIVAGATLDIPTLSRNAGSVAALAVNASVVFVGTDNPVATESLLVSGQLAAGQASFTVDAALVGQNTAPTLTWTWMDEVGGLYGPVSLPYATFVDSPAELTATLTDALMVDADGNSVFTTGDGVGYTAIVQNNGSEALENVVFDLPVDGNAPLDVASVVTSVGTVTTATTGQLTVDVGTLNAFESTTITFSSTVDVGFTGADVTAQGTVTSDTLDPVLTDDPVLPGLVDATVTTILQAAPSLYASLDDSLLIDADGNGAVSAGDVVRYELNAINTGLPGLADVRVQFVPDAQSTLLV